MKFVCDLHIHSKYSRATSPQMNLEGMDNGAKIKGIDVLGTGDFTHPEWFKELKQKLESAEQGLFKLKKSDFGTRFMLTSEISCIYSKGGKVRKLHIVVFAPSLDIVEKINKELDKIGNLKADGRPILGLDAKKLAEIVLNISKDCMIIPAHCMTPWFGLFGSKSGFDSIEECFEDYSKYIFALETGLSADPAMLWRIPDVRNITLLSNGDAHSPAKLGREANVFEGSKLSYDAIINAIKGGVSPLKFSYTIEFYPEEGKYHHDGHRNCEISLSPKETKKYNGLCPNCGRPLTVGVLSRIEELADKPEGFRLKGAVPFKSLIPLVEIIAEAVGKGVGTKTVAIEYNRLIEKIGSEFKILLDASQSDLETAVSKEIAKGIVMAREGKIKIEPGYDGVFGKIKIFSKENKKKDIKQKTLF